MNKVMNKEIEHLFKEKAKIQSERKLTEIDSFVTRCKIDNINNELKKLYEAEKHRFNDIAKNLLERIRIDYIKWLHMSNHGKVPDGIIVYTGNEWLTKRLKLFKQRSKLELMKETLKIEENKLWDKELQIKESLRNLYSKDFIEGYKQSEEDYLVWLYKGKQG